MDIKYEFQIPNTKDQIVPEIKKKKGWSSYGTFPPVIVEYGQQNSDWDMFV